jgi:UDP-3-O-[3-hydroxymyristoyl] glucosamine N-acyltransferase
VIGDDVEIGANSCIDRGSIGRTELGNQTKLDNLVHIAHNVTIGPGSFLAGQVGIAGSTSIGAGTMWGGQSGAADHVEIGDGVKVAGQAGISDDVPAGETVAGFPARPIKDFHRATAAMYRLADLRQRVRRMERALQFGRSEEAAE